MTVFTAFLEEKYLNFHSKSSSRKYSLLLILVMNSNVCRDFAEESNVCSNFCTKFNIIL